MFFFVGRQSMPLLPQMSVKTSATLEARELARIDRFEPTPLALACVPPDRDDKFIVVLEQTTRVEQFTYLKWAPNGSDTVLSYGTKYEFLVDPASAFVDVGSNWGFGVGSLAITQSRKYLIVKPYREGRFSEIFLDIETGQLLPNREAGSIVAFRKWQLRLSGYEVGDPLSLPLLRVELLPPSR